MTNLSQPATIIRAKHKNDEPTRITDFAND